jgi:hypothetical protein
VGCFRWIRRFPETRARCLCTIQVDAAEKFPAAALILEEGKMAKAKAISLSQFSNAVQAAVKSAAQKHPKFKLDAPQGVTFSYIIRGIPVASSLLANATFAETQAFADEVAAQISAQAGLEGVLAAVGGKGAIYAGGGHITIGIPAVDELQLEK